MEEDRIFKNLVNLHFFYICENCWIVDRDMGRMAYGYKCSKCGIANNGSKGYFQLNVFGILDLMQEFYKLERNESKSIFQLTDDNKNVHHISFIILFCSLVEVLITNFFNNFFKKNDIMNEIQDRLLNDNLLVRQRVEKLFPSLIDVKWITAIKKINQKSKYNYLETLRFYEKVRKIRNEFIHRGNRWIIPAEMPINCLRQVIPLIQMFVDLHNEYIAETGSNNIKVKNA